MISIQKTVAICIIILAIYALIGQYLFNSAGEYVDYAGAEEKNEKQKIIKLANMAKFPYEYQVLWRIHLVESVLSAILCIFVFKMIKNIDDISLFITMTIITFATLQQATSFFHYHGAERFHALVAERIQTDLFCNC